ncbi:hypothetical protein [Candidatus Mesenet endosymbiont of Agriotes lineatus]|uniref:hypothetical protein n=1 Tax=Candidatus Mesenet endosymbiont of Agriotes lineatus TaxID=3077948 RepID=UPI0030D2ADB5
MQESLIHLQQSRHIREGERIFGQELQYNPYRRAEDVGLMANLWQKSASKVAILSIFIVLGGIIGGIISGLIVKNLSESSWWIILGTALGFALGIVGTSVPFYCKEICAVFKKENREVIL